MESLSSSLEPDDEAIAHLAATRLGPASERLLADPAARDTVRAKLRAGDALEDAVLSAVHARARTDRALADEFLAYFLSDLMRLGSLSLGDELRRFLDTGDLVQSVLGRLWPSFMEVPFENRARFIALLAQRLDWRAADKARALRRGRRREDLRAEVELETLPSEADSASVLGTEQREQLILLLLKLSERDRDLVVLRVRGESIAEIARTHGLEIEAAKKAVQRALARLRELAAELERPRSKPCSR